MDIEQATIDALVAGPAETRTVEVKSWIDPRTPEGRAKLLQAMLALRNFNGGCVLIGFDNKTLQPLPVPAELPDVFDLYHNDKIQGLISKHASETFDVAVCRGRREEQHHPVIVIDHGVHTPVAVKTPITGPGGKQIVKRGSVFFRSLLSNGVASSAEAQPGDWPEIMQICMDNREADIGRFVRRHLAGSNLRQIMDILQSAQTDRESKPNLIERARTWLAEGGTRLSPAVSRWHGQAHAENRLDLNQLLKDGAWEVALTIDPPISDRVADNAFYDAVAFNVPQLSGWPIWLGTRGHADPTSRPFQISDGWEVLIVLASFWDIVEFQRWEPNGRFYIRRLHDDDASARARGVSTGLTLDLGRVATSVAESVLAGLSIAKGLGCNETSAQLAFSYRWTGLSGRRASFWASQLRYIPADNRCVDAGATAFISVPLATAPSAITPFVNVATKELFAKFNGFAMSMNVLEQCVKRVLEGKA
jgi:hypothetical protein